MVAVSRDAVGGTSGTSAGGINWAHVVASSATALVVGVTGAIALDGNSSLTTHTVVVGTTPLLRLGIVNNGGVVGNGWTELWGLINPPVGNQTVTVVEKAGSSNALLVGESSSYFNVSRFGTAVINSGIGSTLSSGAIASAVGSMVVSAQGGYGKTLTLSGGGSTCGNLPATANASYASLLLQDIAGAATATLTSTMSNGTWGAVSVNLVAGAQFTVGASLSLTVGSTQAANFVGQVFTIGANLALNFARTATGTGLALGPALRYVGRYPDSDSTVASAAYALADNTAMAVDAGFINRQVPIAASDLVLPAWVDQQVANYATQAQAVAALAPFKPKSALGANNGLAQLDASTGLIPAGQLGTVVTNRVPVTYNIATSGTQFLTTGQSHVCSTSNLGEYVLASLPITDPGYPWTPLCFAYVQGNATGTTSGSRLIGVNTQGFLAVIPPSGLQPRIFASAVCTGDTLPGYYPVIPGAAVGATPVTPLNSPPILGPLTLNLTACNFIGSGYSFSGTGLVFSVVVMPAMGTGVVPT